MIDVKQTVLRTFLTAISLLAVVACAQKPRRPSNSSPAAAEAVETPGRAPAATQPPATPPPLDKNAPKETGSGDTGDYRYTFEKTGDMTVANFNSPKLPYLQEIIEAAARHVIQNVYGEKMENFPYLVPWKYKDSKQAIMLTGNEYDYVIVHIADEGKEIPQLIFWRVPKGSVKF